MSINILNRQIEILAWSIFMGIVQVFRKSRDTPIRVIREILQRLSPLALGRTLILASFGLLIGFSAGFLIVWLIQVGSNQLR
jgi:hypothetical protein